MKVSSPSDATHRTVSDRAHVMPVAASDGAECAVIGHVPSSRCEEKSADQRREEALTMGAHLQTVIANMSEGVCLYGSDQCLILCNARYAEILGVSIDMLLKGTPFSKVLRTAFTLADRRHAGGEVSGVPPEQRVTHPLGAHREATIGNRVISIRKRSLPDGSWISTLDDITDRRRVENRLVQMAQHDDLTGLSNRAVFIQRLETVLRHGESSDPHALLYLDLDRFKPINDKLGHSVGDSVLQVVANRLHVQIRGQDLAARLGGDEFAVLLAFGEEKEIFHVAQRLIADVQRPIVVKDVQVTVGVSVGIALAPQHGCSPERLMGNADRALYKAKRQGRNCFRAYESEPNETVSA